MARLARRPGFIRWGFILRALIIGGVLVGATGATASPGASTTTPFTFGGTNPCTGDMLVGTGNLHLLISDNLSSGGMVQFHIEATFSGLQAVTTAPVAGKKYVVISRRTKQTRSTRTGLPLRRRWSTRSNSSAAEKTAPY